MMAEPQRRFPAPWRTMLMSVFGRRRFGRAPFLVFLVGAGAFGLSVVLAMLISEDDLFAAMPIVVSVAGVAIFVGARKYRARKQVEQLEERTRARYAVTESRRLHPWWEVLETSERATLEEVKAAYRAKVRKYHPDRVNDLATEFQDLADRKMKEINQAYELACRIKRPTSRR
jgi:hypothetical protein